MSEVDGVINWQNARCKVEILSHPLYDQLLSAHVACLWIATPIDQLPRIDAQLAQSQNGIQLYIGVQRGHTVEIFNSFELLFDPSTHSFDYAFLEKKQELCEFSSTMDFPSALVSRVFFTLFI